MPQSNQLPLDQWDIIPMGSEPWADTEHGLRIQSNAVNFNYIIKTGTIPLNTYQNVSVDAGPSIFGSAPATSTDTINWNSDDEFTRALKTIEKNAAQDIQENIRKPDGVLHKLFEKDHWTKGDRQIWEENIAQMVTAETARIPGFAHYRTSVKYPGVTPDVRTDAIDITQLNDLSSDIRNNTEKLRFDCGIESVVKGVVIQKLEHDHGFLPEISGPGDYKRASNYFLVGGPVSFAGTTGAYSSLGLHASIYTPAGNMIESTRNDTRGNSYIVSSDASSTLERLVRGNAFSGCDGSLYAQNGYGMTGEELAEFAGGNGIYSRQALLDRAKQNGTAVTEAKDDNFILVASRMKGNGKSGDVYALQAFQNQMVGTLQEGYTMVGTMVAYQPVGVGHAGNPPVALYALYNDSLSSRDYRFDASFDDKSIKSSISVPAITRPDHTEFPLASSNIAYSPQTVPTSGLLPGQGVYPKYADLKQQQCQAIPVDPAFAPDAVKPATADNKNNTTPDHKQVVSAPASIFQFLPQTP